MSTSKLNNNVERTTFTYDEMLTNNLYADSLLMACFNFGNLNSPDVLIENSTIYNISLSDKIIKYYKNLDENINTLETLSNNGIIEDKEDANQFISMLEEYGIDLDIIIKELKNLKELKIRTNKILNYHFKLFKDEKLDANEYIFLLSGVLSYLMLIISVSYVYKYYDLLIDIASNSKEIKNKYTFTNIDNKQNLKEIKSVLIKYIKEYHESTGSFLMNFKFVTINQKLKAVDDIINFNSKYKIEDVPLPLESSSNKLIKDFKKCLSLIDNDKYTQINNTINYIKSGVDNLT